ncbi:hypothetical protein AFEL58S_00947 [Afipia felis]
MTKPRQWTSVEELEHDSALNAWVTAEYPVAATFEPVARREFIKLMAASFALAGLTGCEKSPFTSALPYVDQPDAATIGVPRYYATAVTLDGYAQPVLATTYDGRPTKLDGLPGHPLIQGRSDAFMQAAVLQLYDPDRAQHPSHRSEPISWQNLAGQFAILRDQWKATQGDGLRLLVEPFTSPTLQRQIEEWLSEYPKTRIHLHDPTGVQNRRLLSAATYGDHLDLHYRLDRCGVVVSFDDDFLGPGPYQVGNAIRWSNARRGASGPGVHLYCAESIPGATGALAAMRLAADASRMSSLADALAARLGVEAMTTPDLPDDERAWVSHAANAIRQAPGSALVTSGLGAGRKTAIRIAQINQMIGAVGKTLEFTKPTGDLSSFGSLAALVDDMSSGKVSTLIMVDSNPVYTAPGALQFAEAMKAVPTTLHIGQQRDETGRLCTFQLATTHGLESWSDALAVDGTPTIIQPTVTPFYDVRTVHQIIELLRGRSDIAADAPIKATWQMRFGDAFDEKWKQALHDGFVAGGNDLVTPQLQSSAETTAQESTGDVDIVFRLDPSAWDGRFANSGWLQELPKPLTTLTWDNVITVSPSMAKRHRLSNGDHIEVTVDGRSVSGPVWILPGQATHTISLFLGYGRNNAGRVGDHIGYNAYEIRPADNPWRTRGTARKIGAASELAVTQLHHRLEGFNFVREVTAQQPALPPSPPQASMYPAWPSAQHAWGMVIDLDTCIGCNACVVACTAENNVPVVGKDQVIAGREMHWLRIARYYTGEPEKPRSYFQPVPCMQCEDAPCEMGCPVHATTHSPEGVNQMVYNRCIGTRTCSSYCPYKVRRFNFYDYRHAPESPEQAAHNPDVTLRSRGVMEKCTYCTQRIEAAHAAADKEGRDLREGDVVTACQSACPTDAIVFGDINDPNSKVSKLRRSGRHYSLLEELGTRPRTTYLARRNDLPDDTERT